MEVIRGELAALRAQSNMATSRSQSMPRTLNRLGAEQSNSNPERVKKLTKFFGDEPPLLRLFLRKLGYEVRFSHISLPFSALGFGCRVFYTLNSLILVDVLMNQHIMLFWVITTHYVVQIYLVIAEPREARGDIIVSQPKPHKGARRPWVVHTVPVSIVDVNV